MNILVLGGGGREHALAWKIAQDAQVTTVFVAPGNAGTATEEKCQNVALNILDNPAIIAFAKENNVALVIVGPEAPLVNGVVDACRAADIKIWGPTQYAAQLEGSKAFAKHFLKRHNIPTAFYEVFTDVAAAKAYIEQHGAPIVIKADGLAAGKGVIVAMSNEEAFAAIDDMLAGNKFGDAGSRVVIEQFLAGEEASFICMIDGHNILPMATSQDHKRIFEGDQGPNTGGMGAYSPAPVVTAEVFERTMREIMRPTVDGIAGNLPSEAEWDERKSIGIVLAAEGYPESVRNGDVISGIGQSPEDTKIFHAGTATTADGHVVTAGGRVLCVTALGDTVLEAQVNALEVCSQVTFTGMQYRSDIGYRAIAREQAE